jgi:cytochrome c oxidase subunit 3
VNIFEELTEKPWLTKPGLVVDIRARRAFALPTPKVGLRLFLTVVTVLFTLFIAAYAERMTFADWHSMPLPMLLWLNTVLLILSSVALQRARSAANRAEIERANSSLVTGGLIAFAFLAGQLLAWRQLSVAGYFAESNPANAFFYLFTALHGLHLLGGLVAWGRTVAKIRRGAEIGRIRGSVDLCAIYWHFMLAVWLVIFTMLLVT